MLRLTTNKIYSRLFLLTFCCQCPDLICLQEFRALIGFSQFRIDWPFDELSNGLSRLSTIPLFAPTFNNSKRLIKITMQTRNRRRKIRWARMLIQLIQYRCKITILFLIFIRQGKIHEQRFLRPFIMQSSVLYIFSNALHDFIPSFFQSHIRPCKESFISLSSI